MGWQSSRSRPCARRPVLRRPRQAQQGSRAVHLPGRRRRSVQRHHEHRIDGGHLIPTNLFNVAEGRTMTLLGKLDWSAIPFQQPIVMGATAFMALVVLAVLGFVTMRRAWPYLWREWLTSVDHKRIGVMYCMLALVMLLRGFSDAIMQRAQPAV